MLGINARKFNNSYNRYDEYRKYFYGGFYYDRRNDGLRYGRDHEHQKVK